MNNEERVNHVLKEIQKLLKTLEPSWEEGNGNDTKETQMVMINERDLKNFLIFFEFMRNHVKNQKSEFVMYEKKLDRHMDRMEKILTSFMETIRKDMDRVERRLDEYEVCKRCGCKVRSDNV